MVNVFWQPVPLDCSYPSEITQSDYMQYRSVNWFLHAMTYPDRLGDLYTGLGVQTLAPKINFLKFSFFQFISSKNTLKERSMIPNASNYFEMA